jgi:hypothetical protein
MKYLYGPCTKEHTLAENPLFRDGMNYENRKITDIFCLVFFVGVVAAMISFSTYAFVFGNTNSVIGGMDGAGNLCGVSDQKDGDFTKYPMVYISNLQINNTNKIFESAVCVEFCPSSTIPPCHNNSLFAKGGTCINYLDLKG